MLESLLGLALSIELYEIERYFLNPGLGLFLQTIPCIAPQFVYFRHTSILARVLGDLMQRVYIDIQNVVVFINDSHRLLQFSICLDLLQTAVHPHSMINMSYIISRLKFTQCAKS